MPKQYAVLRLAHKYGIIYVHKKSTVCRELICGKFEKISTALCADICII